MTTTQRTGNRQAVPADAMRFCPSCGLRRGNVRQGWQPIHQQGELVGYTCPDCPEWSEPIRRTLTARGAVRYYCSLRVTRDGKQRQISKTTATLAEARAWVAEVREGNRDAQRRGENFEDSSGLTVAQVCERWLQAREKEVGTRGGVRKVSVSGYRSALASLLVEVGHRPARDLTPGQIEAVLRKLATTGGLRGRPLSHRSLVYGLGALRQVYAHAMRERWVKANPADAARAPRASHDDDKAPQVLRWSPDDVRTFRAHVDAQQTPSDPWIRVAVRLVLCGLRRSEVMGLDWSHVDLQAGTVRVAASRVKTGSGSETATGQVKVANSLRVVQVEAIHPGTAQAMRELWLQQGRPASGLVIVDNTGQGVNPDVLSRRFKALCSAAGVPVLRSVHNVRHTLATALQAAGVPDHKVAALLGHDVATYRRFYLATDDAGAASAAAVAGKLFAVL